MKMLNRAVFILFAFLLFISMNAENTSASTYVNKEFSTLAKKGKLKGVSGQVGMTYGSLKKNNKGKVAPSEAFLLYNTKKATYGFFYGKSYTKISSNQKIVLISRDLSRNIKANQIQKYFGKPVAKNAYKAGKYYIRILNNYHKNGTVTIQVGTKDGINSVYTTDEEGIYHIK